MTQVVYDDEKGGNKIIFWIASIVIVVGIIVTVLVSVSMCTRDERSLQFIQTDTPTPSSTLTVINVITPEVLPTEQVRQDDNSVVTGTVTGDVWLYYKSDDYSATLPAAMLRGYSVSVISSTEQSVLVRYESGDTVLQGWVSKEWVVYEQDYK